MVEEKTKEEVLLDWKVHLAKEDSAFRSVTAGATVVMAVAVIQIYGGSILLTIPLAVFLFVSVADYFLPIRFRITNRGAWRIGTMGTKFLEWDKVKRVYLDEKGVKLSVFDKQTRLEAFRGLFLYFGKYKDKVVEAVRKARRVDGAGIAA